MSKKLPWNRSAACRIFVLAILIPTLILCIQGNRNNKISPDRKFEADKCTDITGNQDGIY